MRHHRLRIALLPLAALAAPLRAQTTEQELIAARDTVWRAFFHHDTAALRRFLPPAAATLEGGDSSRWNTRNDIMQSSRAFVQSRSRLVDVKFDDTQITLAGHTAVLRSSYAVIVEAGGRVDTTRGRATELFVRRGAPG
ncbi:MAG: nuclear transport factor 2 family protein [Gemmatimonadaceae bacterium]